jgi:Mycobacterial 2 TMS Phage Holin (M2 Hol) Family
MSPKIRQTIYQLGSILTGILGIYLIWSGAGDVQGQGLSGILEGILALFGSGASGLAATKTRQQRLTGAFDEDPLKQLLTGAQGLAQAKTNAEDEYAKAQAILAGLNQNNATPFVPPSAFPNPAQVATNVAAPIPVIGPLTSKLLAPFR